MNKSQSNFSDDSSKFKLLSTKDSVDPLPFPSDVDVI